MKPFDFPCYRFYKAPPCRAPSRSSLCQSLFHYVSSLLAVPQYSSSLRFTPHFIGPPPTAPAYSPLHQPIPHRAGWSTSRHTILLPTVSFYSPLRHSTLRRAILSPTPLCKSLVHYMSLLLGVLTTPLCASSRCQFTPHHTGLPSAVPVYSPQRRSTPITPLYSPVRRSKPHSG